MFSPNLRKQPLSVWKQARFLTTYWLGCTSTQSHWKCLPGYWSQALVSWSRLCHFWSHARVKELVPNGRFNHDQTFIFGPTYAPSHSCWLHPMLVGFQWLSPTQPSCCWFLWVLSPPLGAHLLRSNFWLSSAIFRRSSCAEKPAAEKWPQVTMT